MGAEFGGRSQRDPRTTHELRRCPECISLGNISGNGECGPPDLIHQGEMLAEWRSQRQSVGELRQFPATLPSVKGLEVAHEASMGGLSTKASTQIARQEAIFALPSRLPSPASRV